MSSVPPAGPTTEIAAHADFSQLRYAQCWEDAAVLLPALAIQPGETCVSICSAGDNSLALLLGDPARVIACDLNAAQLAAARLRIAAFRTLEHAELLALLGARQAPASERWAHYRRCRKDLGRDAIGRQALAYWDARRAAIGAGIAGAGRFEHYFRLFRRVCLPLIHSRRTTNRLLTSRPPAARLAFFRQRWNHWRWRWLFHVFFSRSVMGRLGRDPAFFAHVDDNVAQRLRTRVEQALTELDPALNPFLQWILRGYHGVTLPLAWMPEHFTTIRARIERLELCQTAIEPLAARCRRGAIARWNLSDIFEYMTAGNSARALSTIARATPAGGRLVYWNMLVPRQRPAALAPWLQPLDELASQLHATDRACFYSRLVIEQRSTCTDEPPAC
jgi:S-adenosylmethionine-diacylglycerol 3-amino-3-carboxypropyl transferase